MDGYIKICAVMQKFFDQSISVNTSYNPEHYPDGKIPMKVIVKDILNCYKWGIKNLYYNNTYDGKEDSDDDDKQKPNQSLNGNNSDMPKKEDSEICESCAI
jgi:ribonucleoside-diphosphate reductase alpha chain